VVDDDMEIIIQALKNSNLTDLNEFLV
mgnify:CR=1